MPTANSKRELQLVPTPAEAPGLVRKYQILFEQASDAIMTVSMAGVIDEVNLAFEELTGFLREEISDQTLGPLIPDPKTHHVPDRARVLSAGLLRSPGTYEDVALMRKDGYIRLVDLSVRILRGVGDEFALVLLRDVTEKKRMERELITKHSELRNTTFQLEKSNAELKATQEMLIQAGKMAALGELAAGIAHELNQPLQGIRGYAQELSEVLSLQTKASSEQVPVFVKEIISNVDKMSKIIHYLRTFTRKSQEEFEMVDVHSAIEEALKMLGRQFAMRGIEVKRDFAANLPKIYANPLQLEQVFINLSTNARDAIEVTGRGKGEIRIRTRQQGEVIEIQFKDDGCGMNERTKGKAFNPFFTTKEVGKGMGLGLSLSYGILNKIHGSIMVESELGKGSEFLIRLPRDFREVG